MPRRFRNFLRKKSSRDQRRYSRESQEHYEYGVDYPHQSTKRSSKKRGSGKSIGTRWSLNNAIPKTKIKMHRSSRSLGDAEVNGRMISLLESDSYQISEEQSEDDYFEDNTYIERKFSVNVKHSNNDEHEREDEDGEDSTHGMQELDRACVRLDGIEVYAIVSALTCATAISCFDNYDPTPVSILLKERAIFTLLAELLYWGSGGLGMMTGLHATLIFSLVTMYGRTALGIDRDDAFNDFFANTGAPRFNGYRSFKISLYCFMIQLSSLIARKFFFEPLRPLVLLLTGIASYTTMFVDSQEVLSAAGVIYSNPVSQPEPQPEEEEDEPKDRRSAFRQMPKRGSVSKTTLSTRNFGVDTSSQRRASFVFSNNPSLGFVNTSSTGSGDN